ncbi:hypothetical protein D3C79_694270 [compost metagenome]
MDRVQLLDGRQRRGFVLPHQGAFGDQGTADASGNRRGDGGVAQVELGPLQGGLGRGDIGVGLQEGGAGVVMVLAADRIDTDQFAIALVLQAGLEQRGFGAGQACAGAVEVGLERRRVDAKQHIALFDVAAFTVHALEHHACDPRTHLGGPWGQDAAIELGGDRQRLDAHGLDLDCAWRGLFFGRRFIVAGAQGEGDQQQRHQGAQTDGTCTGHADLPKMTRQC